ncbi:MAG: hypothetical protein ACPGUD_02355 [Parashewanella sp.]
MANVPVIALCERLYKYFAEHPDRKFNNQAIDPVHSMFKFYEDDKTNFFFLDYIHICLNCLDWCPSSSERVTYQQASPEEKAKMRDSGYQSMIENWLKEHARIIEKAARDVTEKKVYAKYLWLSKYHNEAVSHFSSNTECTCTVNLQEIDVNS